MWLLPLWLLHLWLLPLWLLPLWLLPLWLLPMWLLTDDVEDVHGGLGELLKALLDTINSVDARCPCTEPLHLIVRPRTTIAFSRR